MAKRGLIVILAVLAGIFVLALFATRIVSGGEKTFARFAEVAKTSPELTNAAGFPLLRVVQSDGPWEVSINKHGRRHGYYSIDGYNVIEGKQSTKSVSLKVAWREAESGKIEIMEIYRTAPFKSDELIWESGAKRVGD